MKIICDRDPEKYWCELCCEYTICDKAPHPSRLNNQKEMSKDGKIQ
jgi:hypothetical protein